MCEFGPMFILVEHAVISVVPIVHECEVDVGGKSVEVLSIAVPSRAKREI